MFLAHLLHQQGHRAVVFERHDQQYVEARVRAGVLEQGTVDLMHHLGLGQRVSTEGLRHTGVNIAIAGEPFRIDLAALTQGAAVTVYGQQEVMRDLFDAAQRDGIEVVFNAQDIVLSGLDGDNVQVQWRCGERVQSLAAKFVAGCDGSHGISQTYLANATRYEHEYPFGWLGILADVPPVHEELIYGWHERGFTLASMRSATRSRYYVQCPIDTDLGDWPETRIWDEICLRLGSSLSARVTRGTPFETSVAPLRSLVTEPMSYRRLYLAGDAAHIAPPTGAKGLNLAVADVTLLATALHEYFARGSEQGLLSYSVRALQRVWQSQRFSWWFTLLTHRMPEATAYSQRLQRAELEQLRHSLAQQQVFAENYVGKNLEQTGLGAA